MYLKFPNNFLIPVKAVRNLVDDLNIKDLRYYKENISETEAKEEMVIEEGLKDIKNKKIWEEIDEEYSQSQVSK